MSKLKIYDSNRNVISECEVDSTTVFYFELTETKFSRDGKVYTLKVNYPRDPVTREKDYRVPSGMQLQ